MTFITLFFMSIASFSANTQTKAVSLEPETRIQLQKSAETLAGIWGDTILEGDFFAEEKVRLDDVKTVTDTNGVAYYRITYSSKAWDTSTCRFVERDLSTLDRCVEGRIVEAGFVTLDFKKATQDRNQRAKFIRQ